MTIGGGLTVAAIQRAAAPALRHLRAVTALRRPGLDGALVVGTFAVSFLFSYGPGALRMTLPGALAASVGAAAAVWASGRRPAASLALVVLLALGLPLVDTALGAMDLVVVLVVFRAAADSALPPWVVTGASAVALTATGAWERVAAGEPVGLPTVLHPLLLTALAVGLGLQSRRVRGQHAELVALRDADRRRAVSDERRRIARDLHDVAAHHLSALVVRAGLARRQGTTGALRDAAAFTAETSAAALAALRQVVHVLGTEDRAPLAPQPGLADLDGVLARMAAAGLQVERAPAPVAPAGPDVDLAAVRIVQEALANVLRHRGPGRAWLEVVRRADALQVTIEDDGPATWRDGAVERARGHGLVGMRERAAACGGHLDVGPSTRGGWRVSALLPATGR